MHACPVVFEQSRIVIRIGRRISPRSVFQSAIPDTSKNGEDEGSRISCSLRQTPKSAYAYDNKSGFVDCAGEGARCSNLQRASAKEIFAIRSPIFFRNIGSLMPSPTGLGRSRIAHSGMQNLEKSWSKFERFFERYSAQCRL